MDRISRNLLRDFLTRQGLPNRAESDDFELFANFCVLSQEYPDTVTQQELLGMSVGKATGLDGVAIIVNGDLVDASEEVDALMKRRNSADVNFVFVQTKTSSKFDGGEMFSFGASVRDFFSSEPSLVRNDDVNHKASIAAYVIDNKMAFMRRRPNCKMYYVTTGKWVEDENLKGVIATVTQDVMDLNLFNDVDFYPIGSDQLQKLYNSTITGITKRISLPRKVTMPAINQVPQSFIGIVTADEYLKLITDDAGNIRKSLFYENLRDYQGQDTPINSQIAKTLNADEKNEEFMILNNGVTIVAKNIQTLSDDIILEDYQVVNGCQTSHVIYDVLFGQDNEHLTRVFIPIRIIQTQDERIIADVITSTNSQTEVRKEEFFALSDFQKKLEQYYVAMSDTYEIYYERRSKQFKSAGVEQVRVITIKDQIRAFASMFLDQPHIAARNYPSLREDAVTGTKIFNPDHHPSAYYTSGLTLYWLEFFFRNRIDRKYRNARYHILMITKYQVLGDDLPNLNSKSLESKCDQLNSQLSDQNDAFEVLQSAVDLLDAVIQSTEIDIGNRDDVRTQKLTIDILNHLGIRNPGA